jgi:hypothetical protein
VGCDSQHPSQHTRHFASSFNSPSKMEQHFRYAHTLMFHDYFAAVNESLERPLLVDKKDQIKQFH